jgi:thiopeptide-type bacteriocin biosynthesis protein
MRESWVSLHVFHGSGTDLLITRAVADLVRSLDADEQLAGFFFIRYWEGGPHLRLRLLPRTPDLATEVEQRATAELKRLLGRPPDQRSMGHPALGRACGGLRPGRGKG